MALKLFGFIVGIFNSNVKKTYLTRMYYFFSFVKHFEHLPNTLLFINIPFQPIFCIKTFVIIIHYANMKKMLFYFKAGLLFNLFYFSFVTIVFAQPANNDLANAIDVTSSPFSHTVTVAESDAANDETGELFCDSGFYSGTWWYKVTLSTNGSITANAMTTGATTISNATAVNVAIYSGTVHPLTEIDCQSSFADNTLNPMATANLTPGTYYIAVGNSPQLAGTNATANSIVTNISATLASDPIPTMSQWGLVVFGLLIINLSVFFVRRRELI